MNEAQLITAVRIAARISPSHPDYTDARIRLELNDALTTLFLHPIKSAGNGYYQHLRTAAIVSGTDVYRIYKRAVVGGLVTLEAQEPSAGDVRTLFEVDQREQANQAGQPGEPSGYIDHGDQIRLVPSPNVGGWTLRQWYKLRPSKLVDLQTDGEITNVDAANLQVTVNVIPDDQDTAAPIVSGTTVVDIVSPTGSHELHLVGSAQTYAGTVITFPAGTDMIRIVVGDYVRAEDQSDWPQLPPEFHRTLSDAAAVVILSGIGTLNKAQGLSSKVQGDIVRMLEMMEPRVRDLATPFRPRYGPIRSFRRRSPPARL